MAKGFIEVTRADNGGKFLLAVEKIEYVEQLEEGNAFMTFWHYGYKRDTFNLGIETVETYAEVLSKITEATK